MNIEEDARETRELRRHHQRNRHPQRALDACLVAHGGLVRPGPHQSPPQDAQARGHDREPERFQVPIVELQRDGQGGSDNRQRHRPFYWSVRRVRVVGSGDGCQAASDASTFGAQTEAAARDSIAKIRDRRSVETTRRRTRVVVSTRSASVASGQPSSPHGSPWAPANQPGSWRHWGDGSREPGSLAPRRHAVTRTLSWRNSGVHGATPVAQSAG